MDRCRLIVTGTSLLLALVLSAAEKSLQDYCEFETPKLTNEYWPVFPANPQQAEDDHVPVVDVVVDQEGKPISAVLVSTGHAEIRDHAIAAATLLQFTPAYSCGEPVDGFYRYPFQIYFYPDGEGESESFMPAVSRFRMPRSLLQNLFYAAMVEKQEQVHFLLDIDAEGKVTKVRGKTSWEKHLAKEVFPRLLDWLKFAPAKLDGTPVESRLHLSMDMRGDVIMEEIADRLSTIPDARPMPEKLGESGYEPGKELAVALSFYRNGTVQNIQFLSVMNRMEAVSAINAFRSWRIQPSEKSGHGARDVKVVYTYLEDDPTATLLDTVHDIIRVPPKPLKRVAPEYPQSLRREGKQGYAIVVFVVDKKGQVPIAEVEFASHPEFASSALAAVSKWRFEPGRVNGQPANTWVRLPVPFRFQRR